MNVLITGGAGFLGRRLTSALLKRGTLADPYGSQREIQRITLIDVSAPAGFDDDRVAIVTGDITDRSLVEHVIDTNTTSIFHLAAIVSGMAEAEFDLGMRINLDASRLLLDVCRARDHRPRVIFTSSVAVYGGALPDLVLDTTAVQPQSSYGAQKAIAELLIGDFHRRRFVDGRVLRLPTVSVRPGRPNAAASSFVSGIIREPLNGQSSVCPVDAGTRVWLTSPAMAVECLMVGHDVPSEALGPRRAVNLPGLSVTVGDMIAALGRVAGPAVVDRIQWRRDALVERIVCSWPGAWDSTRATSLGFPVDSNFDAVIRRYIAEELDGHTPAA